MDCTSKTTRHCYPFDYVARVWVAAAVAVGTSTISFADEPSREQLKEPVFRVGTSVTSDPVRGSRPVLDPALTEAGSPKATSATDASPATKAPSDPNARPGDKTVKDPQLLAALEHAAECLQHIEQNVRDYTCIFIKRELVDGELLGPDYIQAKVRHPVMKNGKMVSPFSVYMRWIKPTDKRGREALYLDGLNDNKVLIREAGLKGKLLGAVWLARDSSFLLGENRHQVNEVGVLNLTQRLLERGHSRDGNVAGVDYTATYGTGAEMNKRPCRYLHIDFTTQNHVNEASKIRVLFDEELKMPVRYAAYGWPATPGGKPPLLEEYTYVNVAVNQGLTDKDFSASNEKYGFR